MKFIHFRYLLCWIALIAGSYCHAQSQPQGAQIRETQSRETSTQEIRASSPAPVWFSQDNNGHLTLHLYFFWSKKCPHCQNALPFIRQLQADTPWLQVHALELTEHPEHVTQYMDMAAKLGMQARSVPAFLWCGQMSTGYDNPQGMGRFLKEQLSACRQRLLDQQHLPLAANRHAYQTEITVPVFGKLDLQQLSLPAFTVILAGLDAFNPCAFFVLLFLLSLLVHAKNRGRILAIGGIFVFFSGLLYFLFMAAWLNVFLFIGQINLVTYVAGAIAVAFALLNIKDYFWFKQGISLSIPDGAKPDLFSRMRKLISSQNSVAMAVAAMGLAAFANLYEFLCTAGFPLVFTRVLTLNNLPPAGYYLYLVLYNIIYIVPLLLIVILFAITLGAKKLQERHGRILKLLSGMMMLGLGLILLSQPDWLNNAGVAMLLLGFALLATYLITLIERRLGKPRGVDDTQPNGRYE